MINLRSQMLGVLARGRSNNIQLLRFVAASFVVFFHCFALTNHWTDEPLWRMNHDWNFGALGVQIFFVISGFLVTKSWQQHSRLPGFDPCGCVHGRLGWRVKLVSVACFSYGPDDTRLCLAYCVGLEST